MFIRLKKKRLSKQHGAARFTLCAVLVESYREKGQPRQRVLKYLGSVRQELFADHDHRRRFFLDLVTRIDQLRLDATSKTKLKMQLARRFARAGARR